MRNSDSDNNGSNLIGSNFIEENPEISIPYFGTYIRIYIEWLRWKCYGHWCCFNLQGKYLRQFRTLDGF